VFKLEFILKILPCYNSRVGAASKPEPHKNDAAPQHWLNIKFGSGAVGTRAASLCGSGSAESEDKTMSDRLYIKFYSFTNILAFFIVG
jgi:hypothetical protein